MWEQPRLPRPLYRSKYPLSVPWTPAARAAYETGGAVSLEHVLPAAVLVRRLIADPPANAAALVAGALSTGEMQSCTVQTLWRRLVGRPLNDQEMREVLPGLLQQFESSRHNYRQLVRAIVTAPAYRRID